MPVEVPLALCFLATRSLETPVGDKTGIKQSSMSNNLAPLLVAPIKNTIKQICLPTNVQRGRVGVGGMRFLLVLIFGIDKV